MDASALFVALRSPVDDAERSLLARADALAVAALNQVDTGKPIDAGTLAGLVEKHARLAAAEEATIAVAPDLEVWPAVSARIEVSSAIGSLRRARLGRLQGKLGAPYLYLCQGQVRGAGGCLVQ